MRLLLILLALLLPVAAQETLIREVADPLTDTHIEVTALFTRPAPGGFLPLRVKIANNRKSSASIRLDCEIGANYGGGTTTSSSYDFSVEGEKISTQDIMVPLGPPSFNYGGMTNFTVKMRGSFGTAEHTITSDLDPSQPAVLLSEALFTPNASTLDAAAASKFTSSYRSSSEFAGKFDPKQLPDDWLAFSGYDWLLLTDRDWSATPPGSRNAILSWVRLGGRLVIYSSTASTLSSLGLPAEASYGEISIKSLPASLKMDENATVELVSSGEPPRQVSLRGDYERGWPLQGAFGTQSFQYAVFIVVLVIFGILVGPVNLFVFARADRRHRLFITTPLISLGASLVLIALIIFQDGFGGNGARAVLMEVRPDEGQHAVFIHQEQFARTGVLVRSKFTVDPACSINPVPLDLTRWARYTASSNNRGTFNLQPEDGKLIATGDWFQSRSEHGHILSAVLPSRGRIETAGAPDTCQSTFDFPLKTLFYQNNAGQWYRADNIRTGEKFQLSSVDYSLIKPLIEAESNGFAPRQKRMLLKGASRRGHFIAITDEAPGIDTNTGIHWKKTHTVITGPIQ